MEADMNRIERFFLWTDRFSDSTLTWSVVVAILGCYALLGAGALWVLR
jgi:hypothetical protein